MKIFRTKNYEYMSLKACNIIMDKLHKLDYPNLGLATGSTPIGLYNCLIQQFNNKKISFKNVTTFNLDEYIGLSVENPNSYNYFMHDKLFNKVDILPENIYLPNGVAENLEKECKEYEQTIKNKGGIDLQILGLGTNGHIAFNEPGTPFHSRTRIVNLAQATIDANARFFKSLDDVPNQAISMGIKTIMESKEIIILASGDSKANAIAKLLDGIVTEDFPASVLHKHKNVTVIADEAALANT